MKYLVILFISLFSFLGPAQASEALKSLPVQDGGRIKPFESFAKETLQLVYGRETLKGDKGDKKEASDVVFTWMMAPDMWMEQKIIQVRHNGLREALNLKKQEGIYHSLSELLGNSNLALLVQDARAKKQRGVKMNPYDQAVLTLESQISRMHAIMQGHGLPISPISKNWSPVSQLKGDELEAFREIQKSFAPYISSKTEGKEDSTELDKKVGDFVQLLKSKYGDNYAPFKTLSQERLYQKLEPFMWAWIFYLLAAMFLVAHIVSQRKVYSHLSSGLMFVAIGLHMFGFALRVLITGRAPVTSMYETVAWVPFISLISSIVVSRVYSIPFVRVVGLLISVFCLLLSSLAPLVLDPTLQPLQPVLRDNFWLVTHVLMIVSSYGAFMLAFFLGDLVLFYYLKSEEKYKKEIKQGVQAIYRSIQIGVVLLAGGTILGGVWADYSWGRFWGWDPKETWAFIALMGYLVILHGRLAGWFRGLGMAVGAVLAFSLVIMAWYGVNFVLGAGLHTYGFGAGGVEYVSAFVAAHIIYVTYVLAYKKLKS